MDIETPCVMYTYIADKVAGLTNDWEDFNEHAMSDGLTAYSIIETADGYVAIPIDGEVCKAIPEGKRYADRMVSVLPLDSGIRFFPTKKDAIENEARLYREMADEEHLTASRIAAYANALEGL